MVLSAPRGVLQVLALGMKTDVTAFQFPGTFSLADIVFSERSDLNRFRNQCPVTVGPTILLQFSAIRVGGSGPP